MRRIRVRLAGVAVVSLVAVAMPAVQHPAAAVGGCVCQSGVSVSLRGSIRVTLDNWSSYPTARVSDLVRWADRGMATRTPLSTNVSGLMRTGDRVVATDFGLYWIDVTRRAGQLGGMWALRRDGTGNANFKYQVGNANWGPNYLLPGSKGVLNSYDSQVAGVTTLMVPHGGGDASQTPGRGTFVPYGTAQPTTLTEGHDHLYQFTGRLSQEFVPQPQHNMVDSSGRTAQMHYVLTYRFRDANDPGTDYNGTLRQQRVRIELSMTPTATIALGSYSLGVDSQYVDAPYPMMSANYSSQQRNRYNCADTSWGSYVVGSLCTSASSPVNYVIEPCPSYCLQARLVHGAFTTMAQSPLSTTDRQITFLQVGTAPFSAAVRVAHVLTPVPPTPSVISLESQYLNVLDPVQTWSANVTFRSATDVQMEPYNPPSVPFGFGYNVRDSNTPGPPDRQVPYGAPGDIPLVCDWDGDGDATPGVYRGDTFILSNSWSGVPTYSFRYGVGAPTDKPVCGNWNPGTDNKDTVGVMRDIGGDARWLLTNHEFGAVQDVPGFWFGETRLGDKPVTGDWNRDNLTTIGVQRGNQFMLSNDLSGTLGIAQFGFGDPGDIARGGDWDGDGRASIGVYRPSTGTFYLNNENDSTGPEYTVPFGGSTDIPVVGNWDGAPGGNLTDTIGVWRP